jgi:hypothetical protein
MYIMQLKLAKKSSLAIITCFTLLTVVTPVFSQNLDSSNYRLVAPEIGNTAAGTIDSANYSQLLSVGLIDGVTTTSDNYEAAGGFSRLIQANVPQIACFETSTTNLTTNCTGVPGGAGMVGVCAEPGCYNRAKLEIDSQSNAADARYAVQISTSSDFSSNVYYVDGTTRLLKSNLTIGDFLPKCEWEGTTATSVCGVANATWQKYNILGLTANTTYYVRISAHTGTDTSGQYSQTGWSPSISAATQAISISFDIDVASSPAGTSNQPYKLELGVLNPNTINTSSNQILIKTSTNALNGLDVKVKGQNGALKHTNNTDTIAAVSGNLANIYGYGLRNVLASNSATNTSNLGSINVASTPTDFTDSATPQQVGAPTTSYQKLFDSNNLPLQEGVAGFVAKAKADIDTPIGNYNEFLTFLVSAVF